jgi:hypothetical protein
LLNPDSGDRKQSDRLGSIYGTNAKEGLKPRQAEAMHELKRMLRSTSKVGRALLLSVCGEGRSVTEFEKAAGWRPRYGIERLREALDDVAECRGLITRKLAPCCALYPIPIKS